MRALQSKSPFWSTLTAWADKTVLFSFDKTGFYLHSRSFEPGELDHSMKGKVCVVTGGNSGIGRATAKAFAMRGAEVWILARDRERGLVAVDELRNETQNHHIQLAHVDVSDLGALRNFAATFPPSRVDVLVHNAGVMPKQKTLSRQGFELSFATMVLGPFLLTQLLLPKLKESLDGRIIFVSSGGMYTQKLDLERLQSLGSNYNDLVAYAQGKRAQVILTELLARKLKKTNVSVHAMHPGWANTRAVQDSMPRFFKLLRPLLRTAEQGADTVIWLALSSKAKETSGSFCFDRATRPKHLSKRTQEEAAAPEALWQLCEDLTQSFPLLSA